jgi:hypothetical protein
MVQIALARRPVETIFQRMQPRAAKRRNSTFGGETAGRYLPRQFNPVPHERFVRDCRRRHLARIAGEPSEEQVALVMSLASLEWAALAAEAEGGLMGFREGRKQRRLFQAALYRLRADLEGTAGRGARAEPSGAAA